MSTTHLRENFYKIHPVKYIIFIFIMSNFNRPYQKFLKANKDGVSPEGSFIEFIKHDIIKPLKRNPLFQKIPRTVSKKWALHTNKNCSIEKNLPKYQQFKDYSFHNIFEIDRKNYNKSFLPTDHIAIIYPHVKEKNKRMFHKMKSAYNVHTTTKEIWLPKTDEQTINNQSSVNYNIINHKEIPWTKKYTPLNIYYKKNLLGKYADLNRPFSLHKNKQYNEALLNNTCIFKNYKGIFTKMYDDSMRNGNIYSPFETKKSRSGYMNIKE